MKIDNQSVLIHNPLPSTGQEYHAEFDQLLSDGTQSRQADDFYWQHQNQLQQAEITFNRASHRPPIAPDSDAVKEPLKTTPKAGNTTLPLVLHLTMHIEKSVSESIVLIQPDWQQLITHIEKNTLQPSYETARITAQSTDKNASTPRAWLTLMSTPSYKNYQLFVDGNQMELTLNIAHLPKQEIGKLQTLINQWLSQKGYTLKQLIINGEHQ